MRWTWDPAKNDANLRKHRLSFEAALLVFDDPLAFSVPDPYPFEDRWKTTGVVGNRFLTVVHTAPEDERNRTRPNHLRSQIESGRKDGI